MVALVCAAENSEAAIQLEKLWDELARSTLLRCIVRTLFNFSRPSCSAEPLHRICADTQAY